MPRKSAFLALLALVACDLPSSATVADPMFERCKKDPGLTECVEAVNDYCAKNPEDEEWCIDAGGNKPDGSVARDGGEDASCCNTTDGSIGPVADAGRDAGADASVDAGCTGCPMPECTRMSDCMSSPVGRYCSAASMCVQCLENVHCNGKPAGNYCSTANACVQCIESANCATTDPVCASNSCVGCTKKADCAARAATPACDAPSGDCVECTASDTAKCTATNEVCKTGGTECVQCNVNADCKSPGASRCDGNSCKPCQADADCAGIMNGATALDACVNGQCVDCRVDPVDTRVDYGCTGNKACEPATKTCTDRPKNSKDVCGACVADAECLSGQRCVAMNFKGTPLQPVAGGGGFCLKTSSCVPPYGVGITRASLSGAASGTYCGIDESNTSCDAILDLKNDVQCPSGNDSECSDYGGICRTVGVLANRCTYSCETSGECFSSTPCRGTSGAEYCGGPN